jgi:hypothetical protein
MRVLRKDNRDLAEAVLHPAARAGSATALQLLVQPTAGDKDGTRFAIELADEGSEEAVEALSAAFRTPDVTALLHRRAEAGSRAALRALIDSTKEADWAVVRRLGKAGTTAALVEMADPRNYARWWLDPSLAPTRDPIAEHDAATDLVLDHAAAGSEAALAATLLWFSRGYDLLDHADDAKVTRVAELCDAFGLHLDQLAAVRSGIAQRLAAAGSEAALRALLRSPICVVDIALLRHRADQRSDAAFTGLLELVGPAELKELTDRRAQEGSAVAIEALVDARGDHEETWAILEGAAARGSSRAEQLLAWRQWALATGGPVACAELFTVPGRSHEFFGAEPAESPFTFGRRRRRTRIS